MTRLIPYGPGNPLPWPLKVVYFIWSVLVVVTLLWVPVAFLYVLVYYTIEFLGRVR